MRPITNGSWNNDIVQNVISPKKAEKLKNIVSMIPQSAVHIREMEYLVAGLYVTEKW